jgi:hypothetical protein
MTQNILKLIVKATNDGKCIAIRYRGQKEIRVLEPHAVYTDERGEIIVDGFQTRGFSASGRPTPFWRPLRVKKISAISVLNEKFISRTAEGFSSSKLRYKKGLMAIIDEARPSHLYSAEALQRMGPFLPKSRVTSF